MIDLLCAPYTAPAVRRGDWIMDELLGLVEVGGWTGAPIPWPYRRRTGSPSLILTDDLVRAVRCEAELAICDQWGVSKGTVYKWRKALGVGRITQGTHKLLRDNTGVPAEAAARGRERARSPENRAKIAAAKTGVPAHPNTRAALLRNASAPKPEGWGARANAWMRRPKSDEEDRDP